MPLWATENLDSAIATLCYENEGDCDAHDECQDGLLCGSNNCPASLGYGSEVDCCIKGKITKLCELYLILTFEFMLAQG